ncbi:hypothetical protein [Streptomyces sp. S.PB5]|uniref:hypothetical protein n=1 Tax=Streptomyces sp. S.PB5 TaxID=3020844 RepID=UPI0025AEEC03|nr:hypothetical protein [Streptomyces sp. S.PB5]MDN3025180.1 hypothetical protein [Streptomyces sp. S.PB5]
MPTPPTRPRRMALALAAITAVTLGTVSASTAAASDSSGSTGSTGSTDDPPRHTRPGLAIGYEPTEHAPDDVNEANDEFAACMRGEGQTAYPDFHAEKDENGEIRLQVRMKSDGTDERPDLIAEDYRKAVEKCFPILKEAGITLPAAPDGIRPPDLPGHPDGDELPRLRGDMEKGPAKKAHTEEA